MINYDKYMSFFGGCQGGQAEKHIENIERGWDSYLREFFKLPQARQLQESSWGLRGSGGEIGRAHV